MSPGWAFESEAAEDLGTPPRTGPQLHPAPGGPRVQCQAWGISSVVCAHGDRMAATCPGPMERGQGDVTGAVQGGFVVSSLAGLLSHNPPP